MAKLTKEEMELLKVIKNELETSYSKNDLKETNAQLEHSIQSSERLLKSMNIDIRSAKNSDKNRIGTQDSLETKSIKITPFDDLLKEATTNIPEDVHFTDIFTEKEMEENFDVIRKLNNEFNALHRLDQTEWAISIVMGLLAAAIDILLVGVPEKSAETYRAITAESNLALTNVGRPEYIGVIQDFVIVIENKKDTTNHIKRTEKEVIATDTASIRDFAVNGALFYGKHIAKETNFKKIIAIGVSGNEKHHEISPIFVDERGNYKELPTLETFISFSQTNIQEYYIKEILEENTDTEKELIQILKDAEELHEDLRNYGSIQFENYDYFIRIFDPG